jgi:hypothetical protein
LWLDASDTATITESGGDVSQWNDKSGNGNNVSQATGINQPKTGTRTQNGLNVIDFDGTNEFLNGGDILDIRTGGLTALVVSKLDVASGVKVIMGKWVTGANLARWSLYFENTNFIVLFDELGIAPLRFNLYDPGVSARTEPRIMTNRIERAAFLTQWAGSQIVGSTAITTTSDLNSVYNFNIGRQDGNTNAAASLDGWVGEIVVVQRALTTNEIISLTSYFNRKWGL